VTAKVLLCGFLGATVCSGIGVNASPTPKKVGSTGNAFHGTVMGGRKPISGATITLYEAGTTTAGNATVLATTTSGVNGGFSIAPFSCAFPASQIYIVASGGDAGNGVNSNIDLLAALGPCTGPFSGVNLTEVSTVAAAYAFHQFMHPADPSQISAPGAPGTDQYIGITNAGLVLRTNLVKVGTGTASAVLSTNGNSPATLNTLANALSACVDAPSPFSQCDQVFDATTPSSGTTPTNTLQAAYDIAANPGENVASIFGLVSLVPPPGPLPFMPTLASAPTDWLLGVRFVPAGLNIPQFMRLDKQGNLLIANYGGNSIIQLNSVGVQTSPAGGFMPAGINGPKGFTVDSAGNVYIANFDNGTVEVMNSAGTVTVPAFGTPSDFVSPNSAVLDSYSQLWVANSEAGPAGPDLTVASTAGAIKFHISSEFALDDPFIVLADTTTNPNIMWATSSVGGAVSRLVNNGTSTITGSRAAAIGTDVRGIALDTAGNVWVSDTNPGTGHVSKISNSGSPAVLVGPVRVGGITINSQPSGIQVDPANHVWVNNISGSLTELDGNGNPISPPGGFHAGGLINSPDLGIVIGRSGNIWIANTANGHTSIVELIGAAKPTATPKVSGRPMAP
jgi:hypothetical protein